jgi:hypothetical protein
MPRRCAMSTPRNLAEEIFAAAQLEPERDPVTGVDLSLLRLNQAMTIEERWQANEAALDLIDELRQGVAGYDEKPR